MATCPRCHGHLTDTHRCPRSRVKIAAEITLAALVGGMVALLLVSLFDPDGRLTHIDATAITVGVFGGIGLDRLLRG
jgi:hypothetical protein